VIELSGAGPVFTSFAEFIDALGAQCSRARRTPRRRRSSTRGAPPAVNRSGAAVHPTYLAIVPACAGRLNGSVIPLSLKFGVWVRKEGYTLS